MFTRVLMGYAMAALVAGARPARFWRRRRPMRWAASYERRRARPSLARQ